MKKLLFNITSQLVGIAYDDLTTAERNIVCMLIKAGWLIRDNKEKSWPALAFGPKSLEERYKL